MENECFFSINSNCLITIFCNVHGVSEIWDDRGLSMDEKTKTNSTSCRQLHKRDNCKISRYIHWGIQLMRGFSLRLRYVSTTEKLSSLAYLLTARVKSKKVKMPSDFKRVGKIGWVSVCIHMCCLLSNIWI